MRQLLLAAGAFLVLIAPAAQAQEKDAQAIIDKALKAQGGADKVKALQAYTARAKGNINIMDMNLDFTVQSFTQAPDRVKEVINLSIEGQQIMVVQVYNKGKGWVSFGGEVKEADKEELEEMETEMYVDHVTNLYGIKNDKTFKLSLLGEAKVGDVAVMGVQVSKKDKKDVSLYFDKKTNLLLKAEYRGLEPVTKQDSAFVRNLSGYKEMLPGVKTASKVEINVDGKRYMEMEMLEMQAVERHDDSVFNRPN